MTGEPRSKFGSVRHRNSLFAFSFARIPNVGSHAERCRKALGERFAPPAIFAVPEEVDPTIPRLSFQSVHGFSSVLVGASAIALLVQYSPDWQIDDVSVRIDHLTQSVATVAKILPALKVSKVNYCGATLMLEAPYAGTDQELLGFITRKLMATEEAPFYDLHVKRTKTLDDKWYLNSTFENYRSWGDAGANQFAVRLAARTAHERGVRLQYEQNDRYAFNELKSHSSDWRAAASHISDTFNGAATMMDWMRDYES